MPKGRRFLTFRPIGCRSPGQPVLRGRDAAYLSSYPRAICPPGTSRATLRMVYTPVQKRKNHVCLDMAWGVRLGG
ncbi:hypothetical protein VNO80_16109 [Phaseolus coccineus]|uniref:Uncharacterized protein n=1 Tax=Phaseolus coccineus TaxID=3886 RepID=A0AAN9MLI6_PHACN